jgi:hypothetical protein
MQFHCANCQGVERANKIIILKKNGKVFWGA